MTALTRAQARAAMATYSRLREAGVPALLTAHEAWRLSRGLVGTEGDHGTPVPLAAVASLTARDGVTVDETWVPA